MALDDSIRDAEPEPRALADGLGGEEGIEDAFEVLGRDALAGVGDLHPHLLAPASRAQRDRAPLLDGLDRVEQEIQEHLVELRGQAFDLRDFAVLPDHLGLVLDLVPDDVERAVEPPVQVRPLPLLRAVRAREVPQVLDNLLHPAEAVLAFGEQGEDIVFEVIDIDPRLEGAHLVQWTRIGGGRRLGLLVGIEQGHQIAQVILERPEIGVYVADGIVDLVRHPGRELADGGHFLRMQQLALQLFQPLVGDAELFVHFRQLRDASLLILEQVAILEHQRDQADDHGAVFQVLVVVGLGGVIAVDAEHAEEAVVDRKRPTHRGARPQGHVAHGHVPEARVGGQVAVKQQRFACFRHQAEDAAAEFDPAAEHVGGNTDAGDHRQRPAVLVRQGERAAAGAEALDDMLEQRLLQLLRLVAQAAALPQPVQLV